MATRCVTVRRGGVGLRQRRVQRVPAQAGAFHARREFAHAGQRRQLAQIRAAGAVLGQQRVHALEQRVDGGALLALDGLGHHRGRCHRDGAAIAFEAQVRDAVAVAPQRDGEPVAAQGVVALRLGVMRIQAVRNCADACCGRGSLRGRAR